MRYLYMMVWAYTFICLTEDGTHIVLFGEDQVMCINGESDLISVVGIVL